MHNRFATTQFNQNPVFNTLVPGGPQNVSNIIMAPDMSGQAFNNSSIPKYTTHSNFFNAQTGSRLGAQSNLQPKSKRAKNQTVTVSGSVGPGGGIFSPKNVPTNSFGFGFGNSLFPNNVQTPQNGPGGNNVQQLFTIDSNAGPQNFSNQLMSSLQHPGSLATSKQNSQPVPKLGHKKRGSTITNSHVLQQNNNTISYG